MKKQNKEICADEKTNRYEKRKSNGICIDCGSEYAEPGKTRCKNCSERHNASRNNLEKLRIEKGICRKCGKAPAVDGKKICEKCAEKLKEYHAKERYTKLSRENAALKSENDELKRKNSEMAQVLEELKKIFDTVE